MNLEKAYRNLEATLRKTVNNIARSGPNAGPNELSVRSQIAELARAYQAMQNAKRPRWPTMPKWPSRPNVIVNAKQLERANRNFLASINGLNENMKASNAIKIEIETRPYTSNTAKKLARMNENAKKRIIAKNNAYNATGYFTEFGNLFNKAPKLKGATPLAGIVSMKEKLKFDQYMRYIRLQKATAPETNKNRQVAAQAKEIVRREALVRNNISARAAVLKAAQNANARKTTNEAQNILHYRPFREEYRNLLNAKLYNKLNRNNANALKNSVVNPHWLKLHNMLQNYGPTTNKFKKLANENQAMIKQLKTMNNFRKNMLPGELSSGLPYNNKAVNTTRGRIHNTYGSGNPGRPNIASLPKGYQKYVKMILNKPNNRTKPNTRLWVPNPLAGLPGTRS
jgi:hypothetical protein